MASYKLEGARPKPPPPPLRLQKATFKPSSPSRGSDLLYDLPTASSITSPPPGGDQHNVFSPTSPSRPASRLRSHAANRARRMSPPPPPSHGRVTPTPFGDDDLEEFALHCQAWYFNQDEDAGRQMTQTLTSIPSSQRANYARIQASIRASFHKYMAERRRAEFQAHMSATVPGGSLPAHCRSNPDGNAAKRERKERFDRFVKAWCNVGMPGTKPFFESLWAAMALEVVPEHLGGAGSRRIEWEFDDAIFMESAGKEFMLEAIDVLKGVLGFEERRTRHSPSIQSSTDTAVSQVHSRSRSEPLSSQFPALGETKKSSLGTHSGRSRAPSDPFVDSNAASTSVSAGSTMALQDTLSTSASGSAIQRGDIKDYIPARERMSVLLAQSSTSDSLTSSEPGDSCESLRTWTTPDLSNPEYTLLLSSFPPFLTRRTLPLFPAPPTKKHRHLDIEEGAFEDSDELRNELRIGTGVLWIGLKERSSGWQGSWWQRFKLWWRRLLC